MAKIVEKNQGRALETGGNFGKAGVSKNPKAAVSTMLDVSNFHQTGDIFFGNFV